MSFQRAVGLHRRLIGYHEGTVMTITQTSTSTPVLQGRRGLAVTGLGAAVAAAAATTLIAALAMGVGVDFEMPDGGESIPLLGFTQVTLIFSVVGLLIAAGLRRWSARPATAFVRTTVTLTAASLVPPFFVDANAGTVVSLVVLHLAAAAIVIPVLARRLAD